ncbi:Adenylyl cyclase class-3/4/guanylyl cyclase [Nitrososphaera viennensis EN76]|uniref:Adenylyl cyclase class-3/4/guanylyl cyclase n=2 Tax=Nitrososphaera viennensis TaxID=1034015 RepID=A0A060HM65_9ARCH|nr:Adenylyl cyclase class-3/4/guanylyl cyclase [Nitrososphaera viennensis EN76]
MAISRSNAFLRKHDSQQLPLYVMFVDIVGSTKLSSELSPDLLSKLVTIYLQEVAYVIEHYGGYVLKYVGDAVLGYFPPEEKKNREEEEDGIDGNAASANNIVNCARSVVQVVKDGMNPVLEQESLPRISVKATADYGNNTIVRYGSDRRRSHIDIISLTMNLTAKMQNLTRPNHITIGNEFHSRLGPEMQANFSEVSIGRTKWKYHSLGASRPYKIFEDKYRS